MVQLIGELPTENDHPLVKMWSVDIPVGSRVYAKHFHTQFEIAVVDAGSGEYTTENGIYPMLPGDVFVFSSNEIHCITKIGEEGLSITNLHMEPRYLWHSQGSENEGNLMNICFSHAPEFRNRIPCSKAEMLCLNHQKIKQEFLRGDAFCSAAIHAQLSLILIDLLRIHSYGDYRRTEHHMQSMLLLYEYIEQHLGEELTLLRLAEIVNLSPHYLSHIFRKLNGISLWEYINARRIEKASRMILSSNGSMKMIDIAMKCGFNNTANFNKVFKKQKGITPTQLRKHPQFWLE